MAENEAVKKQKPKKDKGEKKGLGRKIKEIGLELKKVTWPTFPTVLKNTGIVLAVVAVFLILLLAFDLILTYFAYNPLSTGTIAGSSERLTAIIDSIKSFRLWGGRL